ncbi:MAG: preprotein translocase subunit SecE [Gammaproteobacteria bacterium]|nr:preprotein translocase subunit SecE [Gammaproteobacteria bacterium]
MKKNTDPKRTMRDTFLWVGVALITAAAFALTYLFHFSGPIKVLVWLVWLVLGLALAFFTKKGQAVFVFAKEAKVELKKVVWPTRQETVQTTSIVMVMVGATGFVLWGVDSVMMWAIGKITHLG